MNNPIAKLLCNSLYLFYIAPEIPGATITFIKSFIYMSRYGPEKFYELVPVYKSVYPILYEAAYGRLKDVAHAKQAVLHTLIHYYVSCYAVHTDEDIRRGFLLDQLKIICVTFTPINAATNATRYEAFLDLAKCVDGFHQMNGVGKLVKSVTQEAKEIFSLVYIRDYSFHEVVQHFNFPMQEIQKNYQSGFQLMKALVFDLANS